MEKDEPAKKPWSGPVGQAVLVDVSREPSLRSTLSHGVRQEGRGENYPALHTVNRGPKEESGYVT